MILPPQKKTVCKCVIAHVECCASDCVTEEGKYARFAEKVCGYICVSILGGV